MITIEKLKQIEKSIMATAITATGFSSKFNELRSIKSHIQKQVSDLLSPQEMQDVVLSRKNENTIKKLIQIGQKCYNENPTEERAYMIAMSIGTIIKEYGWGVDYISGSGLCQLSNKIIQ